MTDCTAAKPNSATQLTSNSKARLAIISPKLKQAEADALAMRAAEILQNMVMSVIYDYNEDHRALNNSYLEESDHLLGRLLSPDCHERQLNDPEDGNILDHLAQIAMELSLAMALLRERPARSIPLGTFAIIAATAAFASNFADRLHLAYAGLPGTIDDLRSLTTHDAAFPEVTAKPLQIKRHAVFPYEGEADEAVRANLLVEWVIKADSTIRRVVSIASYNQEFADALDKHDIAIHDACWTGNRMHECLTDVLGRQRALIKQISGGAA